MSLWLALHFCFLVLNEIEINAWATLSAFFSRITGRNEKLVADGRDCQLKYVTSLKGNCVRRVWVLKKTSMGFVRPDVCFKIISQKFAIKRLKLRQLKSVEIFHN